MFMGASPGSTGGGIKTSTVFTLFHFIRGAATNQPAGAFHYRISQEAFYKAAIVTTLSACVVAVGSFLVCIIEPHLPFIDVLFEVTSACSAPWDFPPESPRTQLPTAKFVLIVIMYIGRLGALTIASLWVFRPDSAIAYPEGNISIG